MFPEPEEPFKGLIYDIHSREPSIPNPSANFGSKKMGRGVFIMKRNKRLVVSLLAILLFITFTITTGFASGSYNNLKFGSRGSEVSRLQQTLNNKGIWAGPVDGIYGKMTEKAVVDFQIASRILVDGIAGSQTQSYLYNSSASRGTSTLSSYSATDLYWLSRIIHAEAKGESYNGKVAVGNVVLNRVKSSSFPNTIKGVVFQYSHGLPQFSPVEDGSIYNSPSQDSINAAKDALNGVRPVGNSTFFFNPDKATGAWIVNNKTYVMRIGNHVFYR